MKLDDIRKLHRKKHREEAKSYLVEGEHPVLELQKAAERNPLLAGCKLYVTREHEHWRGPFEIHVISSLQMQKISDTQSPQGIIAIAPMLPVPEPRQDERCIYLHEVQDPGNLGTILRTLAWFGNFRCLLGPDSVDPYNSKAVRASAGAVFHVPFEQDVPFATLQTRFARIGVLDVQGEPLQSPDFKALDCYVFGNEARGLPPELRASLGARHFSIAGSGAVESLNLAAAVNMCVYELCR
jgi:RNA methyltransferase, TrmH family